MKWYRLMFFADTSGDGIVRLYIKAHTSTDALVCGLTAARTAIDLPSRLMFGQIDCIDRPPHPSDLGTNDRIRNSSGELGRWLLEDNW